MESSEDSNKYKQDIIASVKAIREKYNKLKISKSKQQEQLMQTFKPLVEPMNKLLSLQQEVFNKGSEFIHSTETANELNERLFKQRTKEWGGLASNYLLLHQNSDKNILDTTYGIRYDGSRIQLGNSTMLINKDKIFINNEEYEGTEGLYELLFMKKPDQNIYNDDDLQVYKNLVEKTNAHKQNYIVSNKKRSSRGYKYTNIIKPMFIKSTQGSGMLPNNPKYKNWDDPNELVDRLRVLWSLQCAGNNTHQNEILSIIEELREAKLIE
jgi:hypothetical protein